MANTTTQDDAIARGKVDAAAVTGGSTAAGSRAAVVETVVSGTAFQPASGLGCELYIAVNTSASLKIEMGPSASSLTTLSNNSAAVGLINFEVPGGFYVKITGTPANLTVTSVKK